MIALLGPPPKKLLAKSYAMSQHNWPDAIQNEAGNLCNNSREYFGGPFFNEKGTCTHLYYNGCGCFVDFLDLLGEFFHDHLIPDRELKETVTSLEGEEKQAFLSFVKDMLTWLPEERKPARELAEHPFLQFGSR